KLKGKDDDSQWNLNSWYYFGGGGENIAVAANGNLILTQYCISGESYTGTVTITDQGIFPGPLTGEPMDVILDCGPCPPGGYPGEGDGTDDGDDADSSNSTSSSNTAGTSDDGQDGEGVGSQDVLAWFIPSILCLGIWLALTAIFLYRFCPPCKCGNPCSKPKIIRVTPEPAEPSRPQFLKARPSLPPPPPRQMAPPPPPPPPARVVSPSEPYLYDFWKETYTDQDQSQHPNRNVRPTAIERMPAAHRNIPPQNLRLGPPGTYNNAPRHLTGTGNIPAPAADPPPKSKSSDKENFLEGNVAYKLVSHSSKKLLAYKESDPNVLDEAVVTKRRPREARDMGRCVLVAVFFKVLIHFSLQSTDDGIPANLTILIPDVELSEREGARVMLGGGAVLTCQDDDGDPVGAYIQDISPTAGCGMSCLQLEPCGGDGDFCLWFLANSVLYFSTVSFYTLTIGCTDDVEAVVSQDMSVTIVSNIPPTFDPNNPAYDSVNVHGQKTTHDARYKIYKVKTDDTEDDPVFYTMSTNPITDFIEIEYATGQVRAAQDLRLLCEPLVSGSVWVRDPYSSVVGPFTLDINVDNYNERPTITNLDTTVTINENERVDKRVLDFVVVDGKLNDHNYNQRSATSAGMEAYRLRGSSLRARISLDYEREDTRSVKLYFDVDDGFCSSETYSLTVNVLDVPEEPEYTSTEMLIMTDEGHINEPNNVFILDEDLNEVHTHAKETGSSDLFEVEPTTGNIISIDYLQLVPGRMYKDYTVRMRATDKDGLTTSRYEAKVRVFDINDRRPYFTNFNQPFRVSAHECMDPGSILGTTWSGWEEGGVGLEGETWSGWEEGGVGLEGETWSGLEEGWVGLEGESWSGLEEGWVGLEGDRWYGLERGGVGLEGDRWYGLERGGVEL
ncbi:hypothetical protein RRG08_019561, partial [Elysia crispata]